MASIFYVECPKCCDGGAYVDDIAHDLSYLIIKCEHCYEESTVGIRDWEVDN